MIVLRVRDPTLNQRYNILLYLSNVKSPDAIGLVGLLRLLLF